MRKTAILIIMCGAVAVAQMLPDDGAKVTVYGIDAAQINWGCLL